MSAKQFCELCGSKLPAPGTECSCKAEQPARGRDIGSTIGSYVTGGSNIGAVAGYAIGRLLEGKSLTFTDSTTKRQRDVGKVIVKKVKKLRAGLKRKKKKGSSDER